MNNDNFLQLLLNDINNAQQLQDLLATEFDALGERLFADLERILSDKLPLLALLEQHAKQRNEILASASLSANKTGYEAFAAQATAVNQEMQWDTSKINVNGGAIALGHPIGASGCRILVSLLHEMQKRDAKKGLAALCIGGGMGVALAVAR